MTVSIIIPVYNVAPYIDRCLKSVMNQTYNNIECILVDDCGTDNSIEIAEKLVHEYEGPIIFKFVHHDHNRGLSAARNTGINAAKGEYIYFFDSDDWIVPECIQLMYNCIVEHPQTEAVMGGAITTKEGYSYMNYEKKDYLPSYSEDTDWINKAFLTHGMLSMTAWNILISRTFVINNDFFFVEGLTNEDEVWHFMLSKKLSRLSILHRNTYMYEIRENSIITGNNKNISERNWINILNIWLANCGGRYKKREVSAIFYHVNIRYIQSNDILLKKGLRLVLLKTLQKAVCLQKLGIIIYLIAPKKMIQKPIIQKKIYCLVGKL